MNKKLLNIFSYLVLYGSLMVCVFTIMSFMGDVFWICEIVTHFRVQYFVILGLTGFLFLVLKRYKLSILFLGFAIVNFSFIIPDYVKDKDSIQEDNGHIYKALFANFYKHNHQYQKLVDLINKENPDFFVVMEINSDLLNGMKEVIPNYKYNISHFEDNQSFSIGLFSKYVSDSIFIEFWGDEGFPSVLGKLDIGGNGLNVIGCHAMSPDNPDSLFLRNQQLNIMADYAANFEGEVMCLGDINTTPWSPYFSEFLEKSGLKDSRKGFGVQPTWPTYFPLLYIPIDHCFVSDGIKIIDRRVGPDIGSDHLPIIIEFVFEEN
ncbi:MAG: hypothetical protein COC01_08630 [Bacteroidetes bacterium]|nr:MAG: hypothetical protein COC01_08630 [Bacteroidota bacterium]